ncbi:alpha-ketoglutarate-dependent dioxygenase AlkB [Leptospira sp. 96542]|nr:alpha-ketoglutarate-dependent dioxygenase AlkB [Leptospira sp. 96542]
MDLFGQNQNSNLLPSDGLVLYFGKVLNPERRQFYFENLLQNIQWQNDEAIFFGKTITTKRKVAWYGDHHFSYTYSGSTKQALPWTKDLLDLKKIIEGAAEETFNSCLLNLYHSGDEGMAWHSDNEVALKKEGTIASLSLGAERYFMFRKKDSKETISILLESGSLLLMKGKTQMFWNHSLPKSKKITKPRINLTFRQYIPTKIN